SIIIFMILVKNYNESSSLYNKTLETGSLESEVIIDSSIILETKVIDSSKITNEERSIKNEYNYSKSISGVYKGTAYQPDVNETWSIEINLKEKQPYITYPSLGCGGILNFIEKEGTSFIFREIIQYGHNNCIDNMKVVL